MGPAGAALGPFGEEGMLAIKPPGEISFRNLVRRRQSTRPRRVTKRPVPAAGRRKSCRRGHHRTRSPPWMQEAAPTRAKKCQVRPPRAWPPPPSHRGRSQTPPKPLRRRPTRPPAPGRARVDISLGARVQDVSAPAPLESGRHCGHGWFSGRRAAPTRPEEKSTFLMMDQKLNRQKQSTPPTPSRPLGGTPRPRHASPSSERWAPAPQVPV